MRNAASRQICLFFILSILILISLACSRVIGDEVIYPDLTLPGPLPFEEEMVQTDSEYIIINVNPATIDLLISSLNEKDPAVRSQVAWALGDIGDKKAVSSLIPLLKDHDPGVRVTVAGALAKIGGDEALKGIISLFKDEDKRVRREACRALIKFTPSPDPLLFAWVPRSPTSGEDKREFKSKEIVNDLINALNDMDILIQKYAIIGLGAIGSDKAIEPLKKTFSSGESILKPEVISAIGRIGKKETVPFVVSVLSDSDPMTRGESCIALGELGAYDEIDSLLKSLKDNHFYVRRSAVQAISKLYHHPHPIPSPVKGDGQKEGERDVIQELILMLEDKDASVRLQTCITLAELKTEPALNALEKKLADDDKFVRRSAARAIVDIGGPAIEILMGSLASENILSRQEAAWALGYMAGIGSKISATPLLNSLKDKDVILRRNTAWSLGKIKDIYSVDALLETISDNDPEVRRNTAWALGEIREKNALPGLIEHLSDDARVVRAESARSLGKIRDATALEPLLKTLTRVEKEYASIRRESAWALGEIGDPKAVPALIRAGTEKTIPTQMGMVFDDSEVRCQAVRALEKLGSIEAVEPLEKCLNDKKETPPVTLRKVLAEVLNRLTGKEYTYQKDHREKTYFIEPIL